MLVSKNWRDIIKSRGFSSMRAKNNPFSTFYAASPSYDKRHKGDHVVEVSESGEYVKTSVRCRVDHELSSESWKMQFVGPCNGLFCLLDCRVGSEAGIVILNPITNESTLIALPNHDDDGDCVVKGQEHITTGGAHQILFGYSPSTNEYKILRVSRTLRNSYAIFTIGVDETWRKLSPQLFPDAGMERDAVLCNGAFHWLLAVDGNEEERNKCCRRYILAFDIGEEKTRRMPIPPQRDDHLEGRCLRLLLLNNGLSLSTRPGHGRGNTVIWKMGGGDSWSQILVPEIRFFGRRSTTGCIDADYFRPLGCATKHGGILFRGGRYHHLELYCPEKKMYTTIRVPYKDERLFEFNPSFSSIDEIMYG